uniref:Uncharacterized protein n=1 Tax=Ditylenchus dipsaci TaxID=166011 RepID=A0A915EE48_9BILA
MESRVSTAVWCLLLVCLPLISFKAISEGHACTGGSSSPYPPYPPPNSALNNQWQAPKSQLPQLINSEGNLNDASPILPLTGLASTQQPQQEATATAKEAVQQVQQSNTSFSGRIYSIGEKLASLPGSVGEAMEEAANKVSNAFKSTGESALSKLKEYREALPNKMHPLLDNAIRIFSQPGSEKQQWDQIVKSVESTVGLNDAEKQNFYKKVAEATFQQLG